VFFIASSWRKWPDPQIDFGRELYVPWRLANGAVLYRDIDAYFGPLSQYFNAALFKCFGPGLMVLVTANLSIFVLILALIYTLFRRGWGVGAAFVSSAVFIAVFGFSQLLANGNFNYATPYAHETSHGFLLCLLLVVVLLRWIKDPSALHSLLAGSLFGLTALLKPEIMLAAGTVTFTAVLIQWRRRKHLKLSTLAAWTAGAVIPSLGFFVYFSFYLPWNEALRVTYTAIDAVTTSRITDHAEMTLLGLDQPWTHLLQHLSATLVACALIAVIITTAWLAERFKDIQMTIVLGALLLGGLSCLASFEITWDESGRCLFGLALVYFCYSSSCIIAKPIPDNSAYILSARLLMSVLALTLMVRMVLNGRIYQYGFYQAALAGILVPAVLIGELPGSLGMGRAGRTIIIAGTLGLLVPGVLILAGESQETLGLKTLAIGEGVDRFYDFPPDISPSGGIVFFVTEWLRDQPPAKSLVVMPEGIMINYLARLQSPTSTLFFFSWPISDGRDEAVVNQLQRNPPDYVALVSRNLTEFGLKPFGETPSSGQLLLRWVTQNYERAASIGGDPLDPKQGGAVILKHKMAHTLSTVDTSR
jgi:hypothetical protein